MRLKWGAGGAVVGFILGLMGAGDPVTGTIVGLFGGIAVRKWIFGAFWT